MRRWVSLTIHDKRKKRLYNPYFQLTSDVFFQNRELREEGPDWKECIKQLADVSEEASRLTGDD